MNLISDFFPKITENQQKQFQQATELYTFWNEKINVISRKDIDQLVERHFLHSLGIAKVQSFLPNATILDVGTGGGFPGIPLSILFPETHFVLVDSIGKKIKVVNEIAQALALKNVTALQMRAENLNEKFDFIVSRAVTQMPEFVSWVFHLVKKKSLHERKNGILYLKGGDLHEELSPFPKAEVIALSHYFPQEFFQTKKVVYLPL